MGRTQWQACIKQDLNCKTMEVLPTTTGEAVQRRQHALSAGYKSHQAGLCIEVTYCERRYHATSVRMEMNSMSQLNSTIHSLI